MNEKKKIVLYFELHLEKYILMLEPDCQILDNEFQKKTKLMLEPVFQILDKEFQI